MDPPSDEIGQYYEVTAINNTYYYNITDTASSTTPLSRTLSSDGLSTTGKGIISGGVFILALLAVSHGVLCWKYCRGSKRSCHRSCRGGGQTSEPSSSCEDSGIDKSDQSSSGQSTRYEEASTIILQSIETNPEKMPHPSSEERSPASRATSVVRHQATGIATPAEPGTEPSQGDLDAHPARFIDLLPVARSSLTNFERGGEQNPHQRSAEVQPSVHPSRAESIASFPVVQTARSVSGGMVWSHGIFESQHEDRSEIEGQNGDFAQESAMHFGNVCSKEGSTASSSEQHSMVSGEKTEGRRDHYETSRNTTEETTEAPAAEFGATRSPPVLRNCTLPAQRRNGGGERPSNAKLNTGSERHSPNGTLHTTKESAVCSRGTHLLPENQKTSALQRREKNGVDTAQVEIMILHEEKYCADSSEHMHTDREPSSVENPGNGADSFIRRNGKHCTNIRLDRLNAEGCPKPKELWTFSGDQTQTLMAERMRKSQNGLTCIKTDQENGHSNNNNNNNHNNHATESESTIKKELSHDPFSSDILSDVSGKPLQEKRLLSHSLVTEKMPFERSEQRLARTETRLVKQATADCGDARGRVSLFSTSRDETRKITARMQEGSINVSGNGHGRASDTSYTTDRSDFRSLQTTMKLPPSSDGRPVKQTSPPFPNLAKFTPFPNASASSKFERRGSFGGFGPAQRASGSYAGKQHCGGKPSPAQNAIDDSNGFRPRSCSTGALRPNYPKVLTTQTVSAEEQFPIEKATHFDDIGLTDSEEENDEKSTPVKLRRSKSAPKDRRLQKKRPGESSAQKDLCRSSMLVTIHEEDVGSMPLIPLKP